MHLVLNLLAIGLAVAASSYIVPGVVIPSFWAAVVFGIVLGIINLFIKPLILLLTLPITFLTLGFFALVINALMVMLAAAIVPGITVGSFLDAFLFSIVLSVIKLFLHIIGW